MDAAPGNDMKPKMMLGRERQPKRLARIHMVHHEVVHLLSTPTRPTHTPTACLEGASVV